ncbi:MAG: hypothetical protein ACYCUI_14610 [Vulcanimicrobiaceae bacterium]
MERRRCAACKQAFRPRAQCRGQLYCGQAACQRERRRRWHRTKRQQDEDYRANQSQAQRIWAADHRDYWRKWRAAHPEYTERNRLAQRRRDGERRASRLAKIAASAPISPVTSGTYRLVPWTGGDLAKRAAWTVELTVISTRYATTGDAGAILQREDVIGIGGPPC